MNIARRVAGIRTSPVRELLSLISRPSVISFAGGLPAPELFDVDGFRAAFQRVLADESARAGLQYSMTEGNPHLRALLAQRLTRRGLPTDAEDLLVTSGSQQALSLLTTALLDPGEVVLVEAPTYLAALQCFNLAQARIEPVASDDDGLDPEALREACRRHRPRMLYLVPTFANPTGATMPLARRRAIAAIAAEQGVWVVEDDPYGELRYRGEHVPPLAGLAEGGEQVLYLGSFSKVGAPGLRLGWLRAPRPLLRTLTVVKQAADLHCSTLDQAAVAEYLRRVDLDAHISGLIGQYRRRCDAMLDALPATVPSGSTWTVPEGGMFVWVRLPGWADAADLLREALRRDVAFVPGSAFYPADPDPATLRLSFVTNTPEQIHEGMGRLAAVVNR
jgi:2-aminoadipate transaminase